MTIKERTGRGLPGSPRLAKRWAPQALQAACTAALEHARIYDVNVSDIMTMRMAVVTLFSAGIAADDIARRLHLARNTCFVHLSQWRKINGISRDEHSAQIESARAGRRRGEAQVQAFKVARPVPQEVEAPPGLDEETWRFIDTVWYLHLQHEAALQGRQLTLEQIAKISWYDQSQLNMAAEIRAATAGGARK